VKTEKSKGTYQFSTSKSHEGYFKQKGPRSVQKKIIKNYRFWGIKPRNLLAKDLKTKEKEVNNKEKIESQNVTKTQNSQVIRRRMMSKTQDDSSIDIDVMDKLRMSYGRTIFEKAHKQVTPDWNFQNLTSEDTYILANDEFLNNRENEHLKEFINMKHLRNQKKLLLNRAKKAIKFYNTNLASNEDMSLKEVHHLINTGSVSTNNVKHK